MEHGEEMQRQQDEASFERIGNAKLLVEKGKPRLRHNRAIEFGCARMFAAPCEQGIKRVQRTVRFV
jgi:hypothetical protein